MKRLSLRTPSRTPPGGGAGSAGESARWFELQFVHTTPDERAAAERVVRARLQSDPEGMAAVLAAIGLLS